jgi:superfamily II DNA or RNA helicase
MKDFITEQTLQRGTWQHFERAIHRFLMHAGYDGVRLVGQSSDKGADLIAHRNDKRWLFQAKHWKQRAGSAVVDETLKAANIYRAQVPVVVALNGFDSTARERQLSLQAQGIPLQLWVPWELQRQAERLSERMPGEIHIRSYQDEAAKLIVSRFESRKPNHALVVMATGLGKTVTACEAYSRICAARPIRALVIAHTNDIVYQLERSFWRFLKKTDLTCVVNGYERPSGEAIEESSIVFACLNSVAQAEALEASSFDMIIVDECHHAGGEMYQRIIKKLNAGAADGPFLLGLTATPWRSDEVNPFDIFGLPVISYDLVTGMRAGFLTNVDYRMYTDNIDWEALAAIRSGPLTPRAINRTLFISEWDDAVVQALREAWREQQTPRAIVFCATIDHDLMMRDRINALDFCKAEAIYSQTRSGVRQAAHERNRILCDFHDGSVDVVCAVDIFNEGIDVPDVNILVFQRVTHSRRIFVQQLGRGLRIAHGKNSVIVLDFVSDIRRFAAGIELKDQLERPRGTTHLTLNHRVTFQRVGGNDPQAETFLREWLDDVAAVEAAGEDTSVLKYPPTLPS